MKALNRIKPGKPPLDGEEGTFQGGFPAPTDNPSRPLKGWRPGPGPKNPQANNQPPALMPETNGPEPAFSHDGEAANGGGYA